MLKALYSLILVLCCQLVYAQLGGQAIFQFLNTPHSAKVASIGGVQVSGRSSLPSDAFYNPASLNEDMVRNIQFSEAFYGPGIKYSSLNYAGRNKNDKLWSAGINNLSFEEMDRRDASGVKDGVFYANQSVLYYNRAARSGNFIFGYNIKYAQSLIEKYFAMGLYGDAGVLFSHPKHEFTFGLTVKNIGVRIKNYNGTKESIPFQVQSGMTFKPEHMPMRISISAHNLQKFNIVYQDNSKNETVIFGEPQGQKEPSFGDKIMRHLTFGTEILFSKNINFRFGYNYIRRRELRLTRSGGAGINWGFLVRIKDFDVEYGKSYLQYAGRPSFISITTNLNRFKGRKIIKKETQTL